MCEVNEVKEKGAEGGECKENDICNTGLVCNASKLCETEENLCESVTCGVNEICKAEDGKCYETCTAATDICSQGGNYKCIDTYIIGAWICVEDNLCEPVCEEWETCNNGSCILSEGRCVSNVDCTDHKICNTSNHTCEAEDLCASATCADNETCDPADGECKEIDLCDPNPCTGINKTTCSIISDMIECSCNLDSLNT